MVAAIIAEFYMLIGGVIVAICLGAGLAAYIAVTQYGKLKARKYGCSCGCGHDEKKPVAEEKPVEHKAADDEVKGFEESQPEA